jgi:hypothetical protein
MSEACLDSAEVIPQDQFVPMVPQDAAGTRGARQSRRRKDLLPHPLVRGVGVFALERVREGPTSTACFEIRGVEGLDVQQMLL